MTRQTLSSAAVGLMIGLFISLAPSCTPKKCGPENCPAGCCNAKNECVDGTQTATCGKEGSACGACGMDQACTDGACVPFGPGDGGEDGGVDAGPVDAGPPPCTKDSECSAREGGTRCDEKTGQCVMARGCNFTSDCQSEDFDDYCYRYGIQCRCALEGAGSVPGFAGVCQRRLASCEECTNDAECGNDNLFEPPGKCAALAGDSSGKKYCRQQQVVSCPCGMVNDGAGYCVPQSGSCAEASCSKDSQCKQGTVCSSNTCGKCVPRCRWDFLNKQNAAPGCAPGETCWVDAENTKADSLYFGSGRCKPACTAEADCAQSPSNPFGGPNLTCRAEQGPGGALSAKRCRPKGECMDNAECPELPVTSNYLGFCDRASFSCKSDTCRLGNDPVSGQPFKDCRNPYACASDAGVNFCRLLGCAEQAGGAAAACSRGQYCCGEDKNNDGTSDPCPPKAELGPDLCYDAPKPPFCQTCMSDEDCKNIQLPAYLSGAGACANGSRSPSCSPLPIKCLYAGNKGMMPGVNICAPSTFNDTTRDMNGLGRDVKGCPTQFTPVIIRPKFAEGDDYCNTDGDCNQGADAGRCAPDMSVTLQDGGHPKTCLCKAGMGDNQCPQIPDGGVVSYCRSGVSGATVSCIETVSCMPGPAIVYSGTDAGGCGL